MRVIERVLEKLAAAEAGADHSVGKLDACSQATDSCIIKKAERFIFSEIPNHLFFAGADFGEQLNEFGLLRLPYELCVFAFNHSIIFNEDELGPRRRASYCVIAWHEGADIKSRSYLCDGISLLFLGEIIVPSGLKRRELAPIPQGIQNTAHPDSFEFIECARTVVIQGIFGAIGCLNSDGVETVYSKAPKWINERREHKGEQPILSYRTLKLDLSAIKIPGASLPGGTHASPRLHWRRGHIRKLSSGKHIIIRPMLIGDPARGEVKKTYEVVARDHAPGPLIKQAFDNRALGDTRARSGGGPATG